MLLNIGGLCLRYSRVPNFKHDIKLYPGSKPIKLRNYRYSYRQKQVLHDFTQAALENDIIEVAPPHCEWSTPILVLPKKDPNRFRIVNDFRALNALTVKDVFPLPNTNDLIESISGSVWNTVLDLNQAFFNVELEEASRELTTFTTHEGMFRYKRLPQGLSNSPATFARLGVQLRA